MWVNNLWSYSAGAEESAEINKIPEPLKWNLCFAGQLGLQTELWWKRDQHQRVKSTGKCVLGVSTQKLGSRSGQGCTSCWQLHLVVKSHPCGYWFWRHGGVMGSNWGLTLWTGLESLKRIEERLLLKVQPSFRRRPQRFGDASVVEWPEPKDKGQNQRRDSDQ